VQRLSSELRAYRSDNFGVTVPDIEDAEAAQTIDVFAAVDVQERIAGVGPLDGGIERALRPRFAVREKPRIDVLAKAVDRFADDPIRLRAIDRLGMDEV